MKEDQYNNTCRYSHNIFRYHLKADTNGVGQGKKEKIISYWKRNYSPEETNTLTKISVLKQGIKRRLIVSGGAYPIRSN